MTLISGLEKSRPLSSLPQRVVVATGGGGTRQATLSSLEAGGIEMNSNKRDALKAPDHTVCFCHKDLHTFTKASVSQPLPQLLG